MKKILDSIVIIFITAISYTLGLIIHITLVIATLVFAIVKIKFMVKIIILVWSNLLFLVIGKKLHIIGKKNIEKGKNYIYIVNHSSLFDIPALMSIKPDIHWVGKERYARMPIFGHAIRLTGYISIKRESLRKAKDSIVTAAEKAMENASIGFFPEGTRSMDGHIQNFKRGFVMVLKNSNLDILPITFNGFYQLKPKKRFYIDPKAKLEIIIHKPLKNEELIKLKDDEIVNKVRNIIQSAYKFV